MTESEVLTINGVDYFSKTAVDKMVADVKEMQPTVTSLPMHKSLENDKLEFWSYKESQKVIKLLEKFLLTEPVVRHVSSEFALYVENLQVMEAANVCLIKAKSTRARLALCNWIPESTVLSEYANKKMPSLDYVHKEGKDEHLQARYSVEYFTNLIALLSIGGDSFKIQTKKDFPTTIESDDWLAIVAPRVEHE